MSGPSEQDPLAPYLADTDPGRVLTGPSAQHLGRALAEIPQQTVVSGVTVKASAYLWHNFQPLIPDGGPFLITAVKIFVEPPAALPSSLGAARVAIVSQGEIWVAPLTGERPELREVSQFEVIARDGPSPGAEDAGDGRSPWATGTSVEVIVQLRDHDGATHLVRAAAQPIVRAD